MRRVPTIFERQQIEVVRVTGDPLHLLQSAVLILQSLNCEDRTTDVREDLLDVPGAKRGVQPDVVPAPERTINVRMIAGKTIAQVSREVGLACCGNASNRDVLYKHVRSHRRNTGDRATACPC